MGKNKQQELDDRVTQELAECLFSLGLTQKTDNPNKAYRMMQKLGIMVHKIGDHECNEASGYYVYQHGEFIKYIPDTLKEGDKIVCYRQTESE